MELPFVVVGMNEVLLNWTDAQTEAEWKVLSNWTDLNCRLKPSEPEMQVKLERQTTWQQAEHAGLCSELPRGSKRKPWITLYTQQSGP